MDQDLGGPTHGPGQRCKADGGLSVLASGGLYLVTMPRRHPHRERQKVLSCFMKKWLIIESRYTKETNHVEKHILYRSLYVPGKSDEGKGRR